MHEAHQAKIETEASRLETEAFVNCMVRGEAETLKSEAIEYSENIRLVIFSLTIIIWQTQTKKLRKRLILYTEPNENSVLITFEGFNIYTFLGCFIIVDNVN